MRVQTGHRHTRRTARSTAHTAVCDLQRLQHIVESHGIQRITQGQVDADQHGLELVIGQHHAHRHLGHGLAGKRCCFSLQQFGVARKARKTCASQGQRLLVNGCGHHGGNFARQRRACGPDNAICRRPAGGSADLPESGQAGQNTGLQHGDAARRHSLPTGNARELHHRQRQCTVTSDQLRGAAQRGHIARHQAARQLGRRIAKGFGDDFRADTGRIAHGDGQRPGHCHGKPAACAGRNLVYFITSPGHLNGP